jgi:3-carboxy-cis,cis-muconate cycloisomerase
LSSDELFDRIFVPDALREAVSAQAWLQAMLDAERALALASAQAGVIERAEADAIATACDASRYDVTRLAAEGRAAGNPVEPLVRALRLASGVERAHWGATSQDILDTAAMLVARRARELIVADLDGAARACATLAESHRGTVMAARTLLRQAVPTTFALKAATWLVGLLHARRCLLAVKLHAQLGGAGGTLALLGDRGLDVLHSYSEQLRLVEPIVPWHAIRGPIRELAGALDVVAGAAAKLALDVALLAQDEVAEVTVPPGGVSSTMPHKRNPVGAVLARACARHAHALVSAFGAEHEHERAAGAWHAEWKALGELLALTGGAVAAARTLVEGLEVDGERMRANLLPETTAEARGDVEPEDYLGAADGFVDRALGWFRADLG